MNRLLRKLPVAILTFFIGIAIPSVWLTFTPTFQACGVTRNGGGYGATGYKSSDGYELSKGCGGHGTPQLARQALEEDLSSTTNVIERRPKLDEQGRQIEERVVARVPTEDTKAGLAVIFWTDEDRLCYVAGESLRHVLALEEKVIAGE